MSLPVFLGVAMMIVGFFLQWAAGRQTHRASGMLREATDAYRDAIHEREEAYRVLAVALALETSEQSGGAEEKK